jgi:hypothetical membrane protein
MATPMSRASTDDERRSVSGGPALHPSRAVLLWGGFAWILATLQYTVAQLVAASAWSPPYSWANNYISDLGNTACGMFAVPHGTAAYVCSPLHAVMNASFIAAGVLTIAGALLLNRLCPVRRLTTVALVLWILAGLGKIVVGLVPENTDPGLHILGALNLPISSVAILLLSLTIRRTHRSLSVTGVVVAVVGLAGSVLSSAGQYAGSSLYLGFGVGGMERIAGYPSNLWMLLIGAFAILAARRQDGSHSNPRARPGPPIRRDRSWSPGTRAAPRTR